MHRFPILGRFRFPSLALSHGGRLALPHLWFYCSSGLLSAPPLLCFLLLVLFHRLTFIQVLVMYHGPPCVSKPSLVSLRQCRLLKIYPLGLLVLHTLTLLHVVQIPFPSVVSWSIQVSILLLKPLFLRSFHLWSLKPFFLLAPGLCGSSPLQAGSLPQSPFLTWPMPPLPLIRVSLHLALPPPLILFLLCSAPLGV